MSNLVTSLFYVLLLNKLSIQSFIKVRSFWTYPTGGVFLYTQNYKKGADEYEPNRRCVTAGL